MDQREIAIEDSWKNQLQSEFSKEYFEKLREFVRKEYSSATVYPTPKNIFRALDLCPFEKVKVVLLGQDPYHGKDTVAGALLPQANGLSFAVHESVKIPPSLQNIFKEIESDLQIKTDSKNGDLYRWATQGVLLLNATLTVRASSPGSHQRKGWEEFTDAVIRVLSEEREHLVFILWGNYARKKGAHIDRTKHLVIESAHPSPFSAYNGFFGSKPFSKTNASLTEHGETPIDWR
jgi:uracil-DNA glycosylase